MANNKRYDEADEESCFQELQIAPKGLHGACFKCGKDTNLVLPDIAEYCCSGACCKSFWDEFIAAQGKQIKQNYDNIEDGHIRQA